MMVNQIRAKNGIPYDSLSYENALMALSVENNTFLSASQISNINAILQRTGIYAPAEGSSTEAFDPLEGTEIQRLLDELAERQAAEGTSEATAVSTFRTRDGSTPALDLSTQIAAQSVNPSAEQAAAFDAVVDLNQLQAGIFVEFRAGSDLSDQNIDDAARLDQAVLDLQSQFGSSIGLLGYDLNGNGAIDSEAELFGFDDGDSTTPELSGSNTLSVTGNTDGTALTFCNVAANDSDADGAAPTLTVSTITQAVTATREEREISISGNVEIGDTYTVELDGSGPISCTATTTSADDVATGLAAAINTFYGNDNTLINASSTGSVLTVQGDDTGASFTLDDLSTTNAVNIAQVETLTVRQVGNGDTFTATVNGFDFTYTAGGADTEDTVRDGLIALINADPNVNGDVVAASTGNAGEFTLTAQTAGTPFTLATATTNGGGGNAQELSSVTTTANQVEGTDFTQGLTDDGITVNGVEQVAGVYEVQVAGTVEAGDVFTLDVTDGTGTTNVSITAGGGDDATSIASQIAADINGSLTGVSSAADTQTIDAQLASGTLDADRLYILSSNGTSQQVAQYYSNVQNNVATVATGAFVLDDGSNKAGIVVDLKL
jgi:hypothetical protein